MKEQVVYSTNSQYEGKYRIIGKINSDGVFYKSASEEKHMLKYPKAWAFDKDGIDDNFKKIVKFIVYAVDTKKEYEIGFLKFMQHASVIDRGHGLQYYVPIVQWNITSQNGEITDNNYQLKMFG